MSERTTRVARKALRTGRVSAADLLKMGFTERQVRRMAQIVKRKKK